MNRHLLLAACSLTVALLPTARALEWVPRTASPRTAPPSWMKIPAAADAPSWKEDRSRHLAWARRVVIEPFISRTKDAPWHAQARRFVDATTELWVDEFNGWSWRHLDDEGRGILDAAEKLRAAGCRDPLVLYFGAHAADEGLEDFESARTLYRELWPALQEDTSLAGFRRHVAIAYASLLRGAGRKFEEQDEAALKWLETAVSDGSYGADDGEVFVQHFITGAHTEFSKRQADKLARLLANARVPAWASDSALGLIEIDRAWNARGSGWASTVTPEGWGGFGKHLGLARAALTRSWKARPDRPEAAAAMITVTMGGGDSTDSIPEWFQRAVKARFDFAPIYDRLVNALRPRWGGSHEAMLALAKACVDTRRFDTVVPVTAAMVFESMEDDVDDWRALYRDPKNAELLMTASEGLAAEPTRARERRSRQSFVAVNGWMCGDYAKAAKALDATGPQLSAFARAKLFKHYSDTEADFASEVRFLASEHRPLFEKAEVAYSGRELQAARALYQQLATEAGALADARVRSRLLAIDFEEKLAGGDWVPVPIGDDLTGWQAVLGDWSAADGGLVLRGQGNRAWIVFNGRAGSAVEVRTDLAIEAPEKADVGLDLIFGIALPAVESAWAAARLYRAKEAPQVLNASFGDRFYAIKDGPKLDTNYRGQHRLEARWKSGRLTAALDGQPIGEGGTVAAPRKSSGFGEKIGLACFDIDRGVTVKIKNLEARQLPKQP